jgi:thioredoxin 1
MKNLLILSLTALVTISTHAAVQEITSLKDYDALIEKSDLLVVKFFAEGCGPCKAISPAFESLSKEFPQVTFAEVNVDHDDIADKENIMSMPTFIFYKKDGVKKKRSLMVGSTKPKLKEEIKKLLI